MVEFDSFDFDWQEWKPANERKLVITIKGTSDYAPAFRWDMQTKIADALKKILNGDPV